MLICISLVQIFTRFKIKIMANTRSSSEVWLIGKPTKILSTAWLPSRGDTPLDASFPSLRRKTRSEKEYSIYS